MNKVNLSAGQCLREGCRRERVVDAIHSQPLLLSPLTVLPVKILVCETSVEAEWGGADNLACVSGGTTERLMEANENLSKSCPNLQQPNLALLFFVLDVCV